MKRTVCLVVSVMLAAAVFGAAPSASAQNVGAGISIENGKIRDFYLSMAGYFNVAEQRIMDMKRDSRFDDEELPVLLFLATRARVEPRAVIELRRKKMSWWNISVRLGLDPNIFFMAVDQGPIGKPYGHAYGLYKANRGKRDWGRASLKDAEMVNLINMRFISEHHGIPSGRIMEMRRKGDRFADMHRKNMDRDKKPGDKPRDKGKDKGREKGKEKGHGHHGR